MEFSGWPMLQGKRYRRGAGGFLGQRSNNGRLSGNPLIKKQTHAHPPNMYTWLSVVTSWAQSYVRTHILNLKECDSEEQMP